MLREDWEAVRPLAGKHGTDLPMGNGGEGCSVRSLRGTFPAHAPIGRDGRGWLS